MASGHLYLNPYTKEIAADVVSSNHLYINSSDIKTVADIRNQVPVVMRHIGLYITYVFENVLITSKYINTDISDDNWIDDNNWIECGE